MTATSSGRCLVRRSIGRILGEKFRLANGSIMEKIDFEKFKALSNVRIMSDDDMRTWGLYNVSPKRHNTLADNLFDYPLSAAGSWATYLGNRLGVNPQDSLEAQHGAIKDRITNEFIIVELNWKGREDDGGPYQDEPYDWHNFHDLPFVKDDLQWKVDEHGAKVHSSNGIFRLAQAVWGTPMEGAWLTDFWKGMPTENGAALDGVLRSMSEVERDRLEEGMVKILAKEADTLGALRPIWLINGHDYERVMRHAQELVGGETWRIIQIPHHSGGNQGYGHTGKVSMKRWCPEALTFMYEAIGKARSALGLEWEVDSHEQTRFAMGQID